MASENNSQPHQSGGTTEDKVNKILETLKKMSSLKEEGITESNNGRETLARSLSARPALTHVAFDGKLIARLQYQFKHLKLKLGKLEQFQTNVGIELDKHLVTLQSVVTNFDSSSASSQTTSLIKPELEGIGKKISDFLSGKEEKQKAAAYADQDGEDEVHQDKAYYYLPGIHTNVEDLIKCEAFRQVKQRFMEISDDRKICLLSFAVFPENREVHRTMLMYWWIGEGILPVEGPEVTVREVLKEFIEKKLVEPVEERRKVAPSSFKMTPFVHSSVIHLSKELGLFDIYGGKDNKPRTCNSKMGKVCLMKVSPTEADPGNMPPPDIETVFNVSETFLDFTLKWFSKNARTYRRFTFPSWMPARRAIDSSEAQCKSVNVFYLGRWERSQKRRIQVQNHELMKKCLKHLTKVKVLSFQGIPTIRTLDRSVCRLHQLIVLDLRDCYDLMKLPEKIDSLKNVVYLDMTGCYMLEYIPLRLASLHNLEVLKGFVVSETLYESVACKLVHLNRLSKLRKLSIEINQHGLDVEQVMGELMKLNVLTSLKVTWRRDLEFSRLTPTDTSAKEFIRTITVIVSDPLRVPDRVSISVPDQLKKLSLQRFPDKELPVWLHPEKLLHLKKIHIGGARKLKGFGGLPEEATECAVEVLRLTSLPKLRVDWIELKDIHFPKLTFLEKYECPRVTLTPCDGNGIWRADQD